MEYSAFALCESLKKIQLPDGLEYIGNGCFIENCFEEVKFPISLKAVGCLAFKECEQLRHAELNEGLEVLGTKWSDGENEFRGMVFAHSGIESVEIPSTLKVIDAYTFFRCKQLKKVEFSEGLEEIGAGAFAESGIENAVLP